MTRISVSKKSGIGIIEATRAAMEAAGPNATVLSSYDRSSGQSVPSLNSTNSAGGGPRAYAVGRGADFHVSINDGEYDLYVKSLPQDVVEPDAIHESRLSIYEGRGQEEFQSFIGG